MSIFIELDELENDFLTIEDNDYSILNGVLTKYKGKNDKAVIPDGVIKIAEDAFCDSHVREVIFPSTLKAIERFSFYNSALTKVTLNFGLEVIHDCAFLGCENLSEIIFPVTLKVIGSKAFSNTSIGKLHLPESVLYIASDAFAETPHMQYVKMRMKQLYCGME